MSAETTTDGDERNQKDPEKPPTAAAFRLTTKAHTNLCIVPNELGDDEELEALADEAREACMELFDAMAEKRDLNEREYEDVYLDTGSKTWDRSVYTDH